MQTGAPKLWVLCPLEYRRGRARSCGTQEIGSPVYCGVDGAMQLGKRCGSVPCGRVATAVPAAARTWASGTGVAASLLQEAPRGRRSLTTAGKSRSETRYSNAFAGWLPGAMDEGLGGDGGALTSRSAHEHQPTKRSPAQRQSQFGIFPTAATSFPTIRWRTVAAL